MKLSKKNMLAALVVILLAGIAFKCFGAEEVDQAIVEQAPVEATQVPVEAPVTAVDDQEEVADQDGDLDDLLKTLATDEAPAAE